MWPPSPTNIAGGGGQNLRRCSVTVWLKGLSTSGRWPIRRSAVGGVTEVSRLDQDGQRRCSGSNEREQARDAGVAPASGRRWPGRVLGTKTLVDRSDMVGSMAPTSPIGETSALQGPGNMVGELTAWVDVVFETFQMGSPLRSRHAQVLRPDGWCPLLAVRHARVGRAGVEPG